MAGRIRLAEVLLVAIVVGGIVYLADSVVGGTLFTNPTNLTVHLHEAGGLHAQSTVNYRGQPVGKVTKGAMSARANCERRIACYTEFTKPLVRTSCEV